MSTNRNERRPAWLDEYVPVPRRILMLREDHPLAKIITQPLDGADGSAPLVFRAEIYLTGNESTIPNATGYASANGGNGRRGGASVWELTETAAIGRALSHVGYPSKDEEEGHDSGRVASQSGRREAEPRRQPTQADAKASAAASVPEIDRALDAARQKRLLPSHDDYADDTNATEFMRQDESIMLLWLKLGRKAETLHTWINTEFRVSDGLLGLSGKAKQDCINRLDKALEAKR